MNGTLYFTPTQGLGWQASQPAHTFGVAWGDYDGDGDLDLALGNYRFEPAQVYENVGGELLLDPANGWGWQAPFYDHTYAVAWGDYDGDGDLDLAVGNSLMPSKVYENVDGNLLLDPPSGLGWLSVRGDNTTSLAWGDYDGDGDLELAVGNANQTSKVYENVHGALQFDLTKGLGWQSGGDDATGLAWGDYDSDGDLDLALANWGFGVEVNENVSHVLEQSAIYLHQASSPVQTYAGALVSALAPADGYAISWNRSSGTIPITYTVVAPDGAPQRVMAEYSMDGGGQWYPATPVSSTQTDDLTTMLGHALSFDGVDDSVDVPHQASLQPANFTIEAWIKADVWGVEAWRGTIVGTDIYTGDMSGYVLRTGNNGRLSFVMGCDGAWPEALSAPLMQVGVWHHVAGTYNGYTMTALIDGAPVASAVCTNFNPSTANLKIGSTPYDNARFFDGAIDEVHLWSEARSPAQIQADMYRQIPGASAGLEAYWQLNEGAGSVAHDQTGHGHAGTLNNGPLWVLGQLIPHVFEWDVLGSHFLGQSDNVIFRLLAWPDPSPQPNGVAGPFQRAAIATLTYPMRVRGSQVRVVQAGSPAQDALVYRLPLGQGPGHPYGDLAGLPYRTNAQGYLQGYGAIDLNDQLVALWPVPITDTNLAFDGVDDYISIPNEANFDLSLLSISAWFRVKTFTTNWQALVTKGDSAWRLHRNGGSNTLAFGTSGLSNVDLAGTVNVNDGQWHHVAAVWDGNAKYLYIDGALDISATVTGSLNMNDYAVWLGENQEARGRYFDGLLEAVSIYNRALTPAEVALLANRGVPPESGLVAYWPLNEGAGSVAYDQTGHGNDGTLYGPTWARPPYTRYYTNAPPTPTGLAAFTVEQGGVQTLTVSVTNTLYLFDLDVSLEWDARNDTLYLETLRYNFQRASELLYDWSDGQAALGRVTIYHDRQHWDEAEVRIYATNSLRPNANQGGITPLTVTDPYTTTFTYSPGQVRMGAIWNRYGDPGGSLGDDWPRTLAHELGHYLLYLDDNYLGLNAKGQVVSVSGCPGAMADPYRQDTPYDEFHPTDGWLPECASTLSNLATARSDWATLSIFYPGLVYPEDGNPGPATLPLAVTQISFVAPFYVATTLLDSTFYLTDPSGARYLPGAGARAYLFQTVAGADRLVDLGSPVLDHVLARGARIGDRLCVFEPAAQRLGCETIQANDKQLIMASDPGWQPEIIITPLSAYAIDVAVTAPLTLTLQARLFPAAGAPTAPLTLTVSGGVHGGVFNTAEPAVAGFVQVWVTGSDPWREAISDYALGRNPGPHGAGSGSGSNAPDRGGVGNLAPVISADGQVLLYGRGLDFAPGEFYVLQRLTRFPAPLVWATPIGSAYRLVATAGAPPLEQASLSLAYVADDVPPGEEAWIRMYFWDGGTWEILTTTLNTYQNTAAAPLQGPGVYALMSSYQIRLYPGWNNFAYPVYGTRPVTDSLASIAGYYGQVYYYDSTDGLDHWKLYDPGVPGWVNDLSALSFGRGYWISVTQNITTTAGITLYLKGTAAGGQVLLPAAFNAPPATFYGILNASPGQAVTAWIGDTACGQGLVRPVGGQTGYVVDVVSAFQVTGCGAPGRAVSFRVGEALLPWLGSWTDARPVRLDFLDLVRLFIPLVLRW